MQLSNILRFSDEPQLESLHNIDLEVRDFNAELQPSYDSPRKFFAPKTLDVEIGCGVGYHPIQYAKANPDRFLIAIEHTSEKYQKFVKRLQHHPSLQNLMPMHDNAIRFITHQLPSHSVDRYFLLYPNPNPKNASQRWARMPFFQQVLRTLKPGGFLTLSTNVADYKDEAAYFIENYWKLMRVAAFRFQVRPSAADQETASSLGFWKEAFPRTHFEKKYLERGESVYEYTFQKQQT